MKMPKTGTLEEWRGLHRRGSVPKIYSDAEVRALVDELLKTETMKQVAAACLKRFGAQRAPGKSAVHRYWTAMQAEKVRSKAQ